MRSLIGLAAAFVLAGCSSVPAPVSEPVPEPFSVTGKMTVTGTGPLDYWTGGQGSACQNGGGYGDINLGTQVVVSDASGKTLALGRLGPGTVSDAAGRSCSFPFVVSGVPAGHEFYGIEIAHRGRLQYTADQIQQPLSLELD